MKNPRMRFVAPVLVLVLGVAWLLNVLDVYPAVDWMWTAGLAAVGILTLVVGGINKLTALVGPFLIAASFCSLLRQTGRLPVEREVPVLTIVLGILMLAVELLKLRTPDVLKQPPEDK